MIVASSLILAAVASLPFHAPRHSAPAPSRIDVPEAGTTLPMLSLSGRPIVLVKIDGKGPFRFILDTGANVTVVDEALKEELGLAPAEGMRAAPPHGAKAPVIVNLGELRVGDAVLNDVIAASMPLATYFGSADSARGVLSAGAFPGHLVTVDYLGKRISIRKGELPRADARTVFEYGSGDANPVISVRVADQEARVRLDTGSPWGIVLPRRFLDVIPLASSPKDAGKLRLLRGEFPKSSAHVNVPVTIGAHTLAVTEIMFSDASPTNEAPKGTVGYDVLRAFSVTLDSKNRRIRLAR